MKTSILLREISAYYDIAPFGEPLCDTIRNMANELPFYRFYKRRELESVSNWLQGMLYPHFVLWDWGKDKLGQHQFFSGDYYQRQWLIHLIEYCESIGD